jgi:hypothetical protein
MKSYEKRGQIQGGLFRMIIPLAHNALFCTLRGRDRAAQNKYDRKPGILDVYSSGVIYRWGLSCIIFPVLG